MKQIAQWGEPLWWIGGQEIRNETIRGQSENQGLKTQSQTHTSLGHDDLTCWLGFALNFALNSSLNNTDSSGMLRLVVIVGGTLGNPVSDYVPLFHAPEGALIQQLILIMVKSRNITMIVKISMLHNPVKWSPVNIS